MDDAGGLTFLREEVRAVEPERERAQAGTEAAQEALQRLDLLIREVGQREVLQGMERLLRVVRQEAENEAEFCERLAAERECREVVQRRKEVCECCGTPRHHVMYVDAFDVQLLYLGEGLKESVGVVGERRQEVSVQSKGFEG